MVVGFLENRKALAIALIKTRAQAAAFFSAVIEVCEAGNQSLQRFFTQLSHLNRSVAFHTGGTKGNTRLFPVSYMHQISQLVALDPGRIS